MQNTEQKRGTEGIGIEFELESGYFKAHNQQNRVGALKTVFRKNQVNIMKKNIEKKELRSLLSILSENEIVQWKERVEKTSCRYNTLFSAKRRSILCKIQSERGTEGTTGIFERE